MPPVSNKQNDAKALFGVKYSGNLLDGFTIKESAILLHKNTKMSIEAIKRILSLSDSIIKKDINFESANNLVKILRECGLDCCCTPMQQEKTVVEQKDSEKINDIVIRMSNDELCNAILSLGHSRAKEIAFAVMKETTKDSIGYLKENAEEKLSSLKSSNMPLKLKSMKIVQILKNKLRPRKIIAIGVAILVLIIFSYFTKSSDEPVPRAAPKITYDDEPRSNDKYYKN